MSVFSPAPLFRLSRAFAFRPFVVSRALKGVLRAAVKSNLVSSPPHAARAHTHRIPLALGLAMPYRTIAEKVIVKRDPAPALSRVDRQT